MSKAIKISDNTYIALENFRDKRETFSDAIGKLLEAREQVCNLISVLEGQIRFREWQLERLEETKRGN